MTTLPFQVYNFRDVVSGDSSQLTTFILGDPANPVEVSGTDISFTAPSTITSVTSDLSVFQDGQIVTVSGTVNNNRAYTANGAPTATNVSTLETTVVTESAGPEVVISAPGPIDLTGADIRMHLRECPEDEPAYVASISNGGIIIVNATAGIFTVPRQVLNIPAATYNYQIEVTLSDSSVNTFVQGSWRVLEDFTYG